MIVAPERVARRLVKDSGGSIEGAIAKGAEILRRIEGADDQSVIEMYREALMLLNWWFQAQQEAIDEAT